MMQKGRKARERAAGLLFLILTIRIVVVKQEWDWLSVIFLLLVLVVPIRTYWRLTVRKSKGEDFVGKKKSN